MPSLADIPGLGGYLQQKQMNEQAGTAQLGQMTSLAALMQHLQAGEKAKVEQARMDQYRVDMAGAAGDPVKMHAIALRNSNPEGVLTDAARAATAANAREATMARLAQAKAIHDQDMAHKEAVLENAARQGADSNAIAQYRAQLHAYDSQRNAAFREAEIKERGNVNNYLYGTRAPVLPQFAPPPAQPGGMPALPPQPAPQGALPANVPEEDRAAYESVLAANNAGGTASALGQSQYTGGGMQQPAPEPIAAPVTPAAPNNLDARDLGAGARGPVIPPQASVTAGTAAPAVVPRPEGYEKWPRAKQIEYDMRQGLQQTRPSILGAGNLTPKALEFVAKQYLTGDRQAVQGFAKSTTARVALQNAIVEQAEKQGMSPEAVAAQIAAFQGIVAGSRTVGQRAANISLAATEAYEMIDLVKETSDNFARTNFVPWNLALKYYESGTGTPEIKEFGAAVNALVNVYARAINPTGVPTVHDKEHAREVINTIQSPDQVEGVLRIIRKELAIAMKAPAQVQETTRRRIVGSESSAPGWSDAKENRLEELRKKLGK